MTVPGQPDMQMILQQAQKMQRRLANAQEELASATVTGQAGNGLVTVTTLATGEVQGVTIDPKVVDPSDVETLQDLVVAAVRDASHNARQLSEAKLGPLTGGLGLPGL